MSLDAATVINARTRRLCAFGLFLSAAALVGCDELLDGSLGGPDAGRDEDAGAVPNTPGCGLASEPEPNNTRDEAAPITTGSPALGCVATGADVDFYEISAPVGDAAGGYFEGGLTQVGAGRLDVKVYTASDNAPLLQHVFTADSGASLFFFWAAAPGQRYRVAVRTGNPFSEPFRYRLGLDYKRVSDAHEPNDTRETPASITLGTAVSGYFFAGHTGAEVDRTAFDDWYRVDLGTGNVRIVLDGVPSNVRPETVLYDAAGLPVTAANVRRDTGGASIDVSTPVTRGPHVLGVRIFQLAPETAGKGMTLPENFTRAYSLVVRQP